MAAPLAITQKTRTLIQVASAWPIDEAGWGIVDGWAESSDDDFCNSVGSAKVIIPGGLVQLPGETSPALGVAVDLGGKYVRICEEDPDGTVVDNDGSRYTPGWWGVIVGQEDREDSDQHGFQIAYECAGILSIMDQTTPSAHFAVPQNPGEPAAEIGTSVVFNSIGGKKTGNRSADLYDFGDGVQAHIFDMSGEGEEWTSKQAADYCLALFKRACPGAPIFSLTGQTSALGGKEKFDVSGLNSLEMLCRIINPKQATGFKRGAVSTTGIEIEVVSLSLTEVVVNPEFTLPANANQVEFDATDPTAISSLTQSQSQRSTYDAIAIEIEKNQYAVTLSLAEMGPDWTSEEETARDAIDEDEPERDEAPYNKVGRRFTLKPTWSGITVNEFVLPTVRVRETSSLHGDQGWNGELTVGGQFVKKNLYRFLKKLPFPEGYDWSSAPAEIDLTRDDAAPIVMVRKNGSYFPLGDLCDPPIQSLQINVDENSSSITLGPKGVADTVLELIAEGSEIFFTLGVEAQLETIVSYRRPAAEQPRQGPRTFKKERKELRRRFITPGTYIGVGSGDTLKLSPEETITIQDDLPLAKSILATSVPWYTQPDWTITLRRIGVIDRANFPTGSMVVSTKRFEGDGTVLARSVVGVITKRAFSYAEPGETTLTTARIPVAVEAVL